MFEELPYPPQFAVLPRRGPKIAPACEPVARIARLRLLIEAPKPGGGTATHRRRHPSGSQRHAACNVGIASISDALSRRRRSRSYPVCSASQSSGPLPQSLPSRSGYAGLIMAHKRAGDLPQYLNTLEYATQKTPFDVIAWTDLGQARRALRQYEAAYQAFNHAVGIRPAACSPRIDMANVLVDLHRVDTAIEHLKVCLENDPHSYPAIVNLGEAYLEKNDPAVARPYLDRALTIRPEGFEALVDIGYIYDLQGDWKTAVSYYNRAIRSDPLRPEAYIDLGYDYNEHRFFPLAEAAFLKGISVASDDGRLHYLLAVTYNLQGKIELARGEYHQALATGEPDVARAARAELALLPPA